MEIVIAGEGAVVIRFIDKSGQTLLEERIAVSGSPTVQAIRVVDLSLNTTGGRALLAPVLMQQPIPSSASPSTARRRRASRARVARRSAAARRSRKAPRAARRRRRSRDLPRDRRRKARSGDPVGGARGLAAAVAKGASFPRTLDTATAFPTAKIIDCLMFRRM